MTDQAIVFIDPIGAPAWHCMDRVAFFGSKGVHPAHEYAPPRGSPRTSRLQNNGLAPCAPFPSPGSKMGPPVPKNFTVP